MINLFLIDNQPTFIYGLKAIFEEADSDIQVSGSASSSKKTLEFLEKNKVNILLLDPSINESLNNKWIEKIKKTYKDIKIIVLTNELDINYLNNLWKAGVDGVELKSCGKKALLSLINGILEGRRVIGKEIPDFLNNSNYNKMKEEPKLSFKEKEIYQLMLSVNSYEDIARKLKLPLIAVEFHCKNILKKIRKSNYNPVLKDVRKNQLVG